MRGLSMDATIRRSIVSGKIGSPPSVPIAHRALLAASLSSGGQSVISGIPDSMEIRATLSACKAFGADIIFEEGVADVFGAPELSAPSSLDCTPSGIALRLFLPLASVFDSDVLFTGNISSDENLEPFRAYLDRLGADCFISGGKLPMKVRGPLKENRLVYPSRLGTPFFSGMLFSLPLLGVDSEIGVEGNFQRSDLVEATIDLMLRCKVGVNRHFEDFLEIEGGQYYDPLGKYEIPGSAYCSSFLVLAGALCGKVKVSNAGISPVFESLLSKFSAQVQSSNHVILSSAGSLEAATLDAVSLGAYLPHAIVLASIANGKSTFENYGSIPSHMKRTTGILTRELSKMGAKTSSDKGNLSITGGNLTGAVLDPEGNATAAMCCALASLCAAGKSQLTGVECITGRHPWFFRDLAGLGAIIR